MRSLILCFILAGTPKIISGQEVCSDDNPACASETGVATLEVYETDCAPEISVYSGASSVDFGSLQKPGSGSSGEMTLNPVDGSIQRTGVTPAQGRSPAFGMLQVDPPGCIRCAVEVVDRQNRTRTLEHESEPGARILFAIKMAEYRSWRGWWWGMEYLNSHWGVSPTPSDPSPWVRYRLGGTISGITSDSPEGTYTGAISVSLWCN